MSLETTRERKEKGGERGEKKKGLLALIIFILPTLEIVSERQKSARDTPLGHLNREVPFSKIRVYIYIYIYIHIHILVEGKRGRATSDEKNLIKNLGNVPNILKNILNVIIQSMRAPLDKATCYIRLL